MESSWEDLLNRQHGVVSRRQAVGHLSPGAIERRLRSGRWQAVHRGIYVTHSGPVDRRQRRWVAALAAGAGRVGLLGGLSALETLGLRGFDSEAVHVLVPAGRTVRNQPPAVVVHRSSVIAPADVHRLGNPPGTAAARSLVDAAQWSTTPDRARAIVAAVFQQRMVRGPDVEAVLARASRMRHRAVVVEAVRDAAAGAHSLPEADFLRLCRGAGFPTPELQCARHDRSGRQRYLDAYFKDWGLHVEIDGGQHCDIRQWWADMRRQNELWIPGDRVLRFPAWAVRHRAGEVAAQVRAALSAAGWPGSGKDRGGRGVTRGG